MDIVFALAAALFYALGTVLQQQVASRSSEEEARSAGFLVRLARQPRWLAGVASDAVGFVAQAVALAAGRLVVVQPLMATSMVFALPLGAKLGRRRVGRRQLAAAIAVTAGLAAFLIAADPSGGRDDATTAAWIVSFAVIAGVSGALMLAARGRAPAMRAALLGSAAGIMFGLAAALTKATVELLDEGVLTVLGDWHLYALIAVGYLSMSLSQRSLQSGALAPASATQMSLDPISSVLLGTLAFDETIHDTAAGAAAALAALVVVIAGLVYLAASEQRPAEAPPAERPPERAHRP